MRQKKRERGFGFQDKSDILRMKIERGVARTASPFPWQGLEGRVYTEKVFNTTIR